MGKYIDNTLKNLFSTNVCAYPDCNVIMVEDRIVFGKICHIQGDKPGSPRHNPAMTQEQRDDFDNLLLMCQKHHDIIDKDIVKHTTEYLEKIKSDLKKKSRVEYVGALDVVKVVKIS